MVSINTGEELGDNTVMKILLASVAGLVIGVAVAKAPWPESGTDSTNPTAPVSATDLVREMVENEPLPDDLDPRYVQMIDALAAVVDQEVLERRRLEERINILTRQLETQSPNAAVTAVKPPAGAPDQSGQQTLVDRLKATGMSSVDANEIKALVDEISLAQLNFEDQARRGNWDREARKQARLELEQKRASLRQNLGESKYDQYLYATGRPNRLTVTDVIGNSAAEKAGLKPGDVVLRYGGERLYDRRDLRSVTQQGNGGEMMTVEIVRNGRTLQMFLPRGPLGVQLGMTSVNPAEGG